MFQSQPCWNGKFSACPMVVNSIWEARKSGTIKNYCYALRKFFEYRVLSSFELRLPIDAVSACAYLTHLKESGAAVGAVKMAYNAMKWAHNFVPGINSYNDPLDEKVVKRVFESAQRAMKPLRNQKQPLPKEIVDKILDSVQDSKCVKEVRDAVIVTLAFNLLLRHDEISHLCCSHLSKDGENLKILITASKTDALRNGKVSWLAKGRTLNLLERYLKLSGLRLGMNQFLFGPLIISTEGCKIKNEILSYNTYRAILKKHLERQGVDPNSFGFHSCRSGGATELASSSTPFELMTTGRWKDQRSLAHYVEIPAERRLELSKSLQK